MPKKHPTVCPQEVDSNIARLLLDRLEAARSLGGAIVREKQHEHWHTRAYSVGKPWYNYEDYIPEDVAVVRERKRLRVVERWFHVGQQHGVVSITQQFIYKRPLDFFAEESTDEKVTQHIKLGFLSSGAVIGKLMIRGDTELPYFGGVADECFDAAQLFYFEQPLLEDDYRFSAPATLDMHGAVKEVDAFIAEEQGLAKLRSAISG